MGPDLLGTMVNRVCGQRFPLLLKFLDVAHYLGVQIHPDDAASVQRGLSDSGKSEAWYIVWAAPGAIAYWGPRPGVTKDDIGTAIDQLPPFEEVARRSRLTRAEMDAAIAGDPVVALLRPVHVKTGDTLYVPPGWIHACGPGVLIFEVQQNADVTLVPQRVFADRRRRDDLAGGPARELFLGLSVMADIPLGQEAIPPVIVAEGNNKQALSAGYTLFRP